MYNNQRIIKELKPYIPAADIFRIYEKEAGCAFLDSSLVNDLGKYSLIGRYPYLKLVKDGDVFTVNGKPETGKTFEDYMREYICESEDVKETDIYVQDLEWYQECFVTNSLMGIMPVRQIGGVRFEEDTVTKELMKKYQKNIYQKVGKLIQ